MKKFLGLVMFIGVVALALNFYGHQSLNGLQTTHVFAAPQNGVYFLNGQLSLPQLSTGAVSPSQVVVTVSAAGSTIYTGVTGASGFQINQISLATGDQVDVILNSSDPVDTGINAVRGEVTYGNTF